MSGFVGSAHDAVGQLQAEVQRMRDGNDRLIRVLRQVVEARHDAQQLQDALDTAEQEIARALKGR